MNKTILDSFIKEAIKTESVNFVDISRRLRDKRTIRLLHAALGLSTEANEFLDAMKKWIFYGKELDLINLKEELGDLNWYQAISMDELGTNYEEILATVIKKLRARYKLENGEKGFTENAATNRNLLNEREILKNSGISIEEAKKQYPNTYEESDLELLDVLKEIGLSPITIDEETKFDPDLKAAMEDD